MAAVCCGKPVDMAKTPAVLCSSCNKPFHVKCMATENPITHVPTLIKIAEIFVKNRTEFYCSDSCKDSKDFKDADSTSPALEREVAEVKDMVFRLANFVGANNCDSDGFIPVVSRKSKRSSYAKAATASSLQELVYQTAVAGVNNAPKAKEEEEKMMRTIVIEGLQCPDEQDDDLASDEDSVTQILQQIGCPDVKPEGIQRQRKQGDGGRPAVLKVFLQSKRDRDFVLKNKRKLKDTTHFKACFMRPSLPEETRFRRDRLRQIALTKAKQENFANIKESSYRVVLNDFNEQYELRRLNSESRIDWRSPPILPSKEEWTSAVDAFEATRIAGNATRGGRR